MTDYRLARQAMQVRIADQTQREIFHHEKVTPPLAVVLVMARREAVEALAALVSTPPTEIEAIRMRQNEVQRYNDLVTFVRKVLDEGNAAYEEIQQAELEDVRAEIADADAENEELVEGELA